MSSILFVDYQTVIPASWLNDVNNAVYNGIWPSANLTVNNLTVNTSLSGSGVNALFASPPPIGSTAPNTGVFTGLTANGTVTGSGFANYFASPPAIGGTAPNSGKFTTVSLTGTGAMQLNVGDTSQRPTGSDGLIRANSELHQFEGYINGSWGTIGGAAISNDTTTGTPLYPLFANSTTGTALTIYTSDTNYLYTPATGVLQSPIVSASNGMFFNSNVIASNVVVQSNQNAGSFGPMAVNDGVTVTIFNNANWVIV